MSAFLILLGGLIWILPQLMRERSVEKKFFASNRGKSTTSINICLGKNQRQSLNVNLLDLASKIEVSVLPKRFDTKEKETLQLSIKGSNSLILTRLGEKIYLKKNKDNLFFTKEKTQFWVSFDKKEGNSVQAFVEAKLSDFDPLYYEIQNKTSYAIKPKLKVTPELLQEKPFQIFSNAQWWGLDLLASFVEPKHEGIHRIILNGKTLLVSEGESFTWDGEKWCPATKKTEGFALAYIKKILDEQIVMDGWDETGKRYVAFSISKRPQPSFEHQSKTLVSNPRLRSTKRISCQVGKQRISLCEKDWVVQESGRWKVISKAEQLQYLKKSSVGEIFVFEAIETQKGKKVLTGKLLNSTHTQMAKISIPLLIRERVKRSNRKNVL